MTSAYRVNLKVPTTVDDCMTKHTPGPWTLAYTSRHGYMVKAGAETICHLISEGTSSANARLIAAAPALLASLAELLPLAKIGAQETGEASAEIGRAAKLLNDLGEKP